MSQRVYERKYCHMSLFIKVIPKKTDFKVLIDSYAIYIINDIILRY